MGDERDEARILVGIAGGSASGKSLVATKVLESLGKSRVAVVRQDRYYRDLSHLTSGERARVNFDHPSAIDAPLLHAHLSTLLLGEGVAAPTYDFTRHIRRPEVAAIVPRPIIVVEGILVLADPDLRSMMSLKVFVETASDIRLLRRIRRDVASRGRDLSSVLEQYERAVRPMHAEFVEPTKEFADIILQEGGHDRAAIARLCAKIESVLAVRRGEVKEEG